MRTVSLYAGTGAEARRHFAVIAAGKVDNIIATYANAAHYEWIGGPPVGTYFRARCIRGVRARFTKARTPLTVDRSGLQQSANSDGATITGNVERKGKKPIKVRHVPQCRYGRRVNEIWQIDRHLKIARY